MKLGKKKLIVGMICLILCFSMTACSEETAKNLAQDIDDQVSNLKDIDESHVVSVRTGCPVLYPNISYGDAFTEFFDDPTWKYFKADTGEDVVEFTGYCMYREKKVKARLQFILNEKDNTFTQGALSFNDVPQTSIITSVMICKAFDEYAEKTGDTCGS